LVGESKKWNIGGKLEKTWKGKGLGSTFLVLVWSNAQPYCCQEDVDVQLLHVKKNLSKT